MNAIHHEQVVLLTNVYSLSTPALSSTSVADPDSFIADPDSFIMVRIRALKLNLDTDPSQYTLANRNSLVHTDKCEN